MRRLRQWFRRRAARPSPAVPRAQLGVEQLERRDVPSTASTFVDLGGHRVEFDVDAGHHLFQRDEQGTHFLANGVQFAHAFRDPLGRLGLDVVLTNGQFLFIDANGPRTLAGNILTASTTFDAAGHPVFDIVFTNHTAVRISSAGVQSLGSNVLAITNFRDAAGNVGFEIVFINHVAFEVDSFGSRMRGNGFLFLNRFTDDFVEVGHRELGVRNNVLDAVFINQEHDQLDDDHGLLHREGEPGNDRGAAEVEPGDDHGAMGELADDHGDHGIDDHSGHGG